MTTVPSLDEIGAEREVADDLDRDAVQLRLPGGAVHPEKGASAPVYKHRIRRFQPPALGVDLGERKDRPVRVEGESPDQENLAVRRVLPEHVEPVGVERAGAGDTRELPRRIELGGGERILCGELVFVRALHKEIAVEPADHHQGAVEKGALEAELHQHQQHRKADAAARAQQPALVCGEVAPGERNRMQRGPAGEGGGDRHGRRLAQNTSAGSARRRPPSANSADTAAMPSAAPSTAARWPSVIVTGSIVRCWISR